MSLFKKKEKRSIQIPTEILKLNNLWSGLNETNNVVVFCTQLISNIVSSLPLILYTRDNKGNKKIAGWHDLYRVVKYRPNLNEPSSVFYSLIVQDLILKGNCFIYKIKTNNKISQLVRIDPSIVKIETRGFEKVFRIKDRVYTQNDIVHIPSSLGYDGVEGKGVLKYAQESIMTSNQMQNFLRFVFDNGFLSKLKLNLNESDYKNLDTAKVRELLDFFSYLLSGANLGKPIIEYAGIKMESLKTENNTDELYKNREFVDKQICNYFNVPYQLLVGENKYNSFEQFNQFFITTCLNQYTDRIAEYFTYFLLPENEAGVYFFEFDYAELLSTDIKSLSNMTIEQVKNGIISINEARQKLNYNALNINSADTNFIVGIGLVRDDVFESWGSTSKLKQKKLEESKID